MPLGKGVRYRVKTEPSGTKVRLAFQRGRVIEDVHTPDEFAADRTAAAHRRHKPTRKSH